MSEPGELLAGFGVNRVLESTSDSYPVSSEGSRPFLRSPMSTISNPCSASGSLGSAGLAAGSLGLDGPERFCFEGAGVANQLSSPPDADSVRELPSMTWKWSLCFGKQIWWLIR